MLNLFFSNYSNPLSDLKGMSFSSAKEFFLLLFGKDPEIYTGDAVFQDRPGTDNPFQPYYNAHIRPHIQEFEAKRVEALKTFGKRSFQAICMVMVGITGTLIFMFQAGLPKVANDVIFFACFMGILGAMSWAYMPAKRYKASVKSIVFPEIFRFFGPDFTFSEESPLSAQDLEPSSIIPSSYERERREDYVKGAYKDVSIELFESHLTRTVGSGKSRREQTLFQGMFILLDMNKNFAGKTIVKRDQGMLGNWISNKVGKLENVRLEDPVFEKEFEVYGDDQIEARTLLTTSFMERLLQLSKLFKNAKIEASFYNDRLLLKIPSPDNRFETSSIYKPATFTDDIETILTEMQVIFEIIDILKLNERTGL
jgi:hypothetical protein